MKMSKNIIIATGGTGGHVLPACSLAELLLEKGFKVKIVIDARGSKYIGNYKEMNYEIISSGTIFKKNPINILFSSIKIIFAFLKSILIMIKFKPKIVFGMGGYSSFPVCIVAKIFRIPVIIYENNLHAGKANRFLLPFANKMFVSYLSLEGINNKYRHKVFEVGNLIRKNILNYSGYKEKKISNTMTILVLGGSQGAKTFALKLPLVFQKCVEYGISLNVYQQCLPAQNQELKNYYDSLKIKNEIFNFTNDLLSIFPKIDLAITRSGSSMLAELLNCSIPIVSIPLPSSAENHQLKNAKYFEKLGYSFLIEEDKIPEKLFPLIKSIHEDKELLNQMRKKQMMYSDKEVFKKIQSQIKEMIND